MIVDKSAIGPQGRPLIRLKATSSVVEPKSTPAHREAVSAPAKGLLKLNARQAAIRECEDWLRSRWPAAFESHRPLAIGVGDIIVAAAEIEGRALLPVKRVSMAERKCARWRLKSVPVRFREKGRAALLVV